MPLADVFSALAKETFGANGSSLQDVKLNPLYRYLRVEAQGHLPVLLVLGYLDAHPQGDIEVWYSAQGEVIKIQNGRIVGTVGLGIDWRAVRFPSAPPVWSEIPTQGGAYQRLRDEMPGHRSAISDRLEIKPWPGLPPIALPTSLSVDQARSYAWFRELTVNTHAQPLPPAWFAWGLHRGQPTVVYSEQCLSASFCLRLQPWPVQKEAL